MRLTDRMRAALMVLVALPLGRTGSAYGLRLRLDTLEHLRIRGLAEAGRGVGSMASPRTHIRWRATDAGRTALAEADTDRGGRADG